jgi:DNA-binding beta-propeller fold protein YncE
MKNIRTISILPILLGILLQGCGHLETPLSPAGPATSAPATTPTPISSPTFSMAFTAGTDPNNAYPVGIAYDTASDALYVTDADLNLVYKFSPNGTLLAQWGNQGGTTLSEPQGLVVHNGKIYVADAGNSRVVEYDNNGNVVATLQPQDGDFYLFNFPTGLFFDDQGNLYVADNSDKIYRFNTSLALTGQYDGNGQLDFPANGCEDASGNIYMANYNSNQVLKLQQNGTQVSVWGQAGTGAGQFNGPNDVKMGPDGNLYVVDMFNDRIQGFSPSGQYLMQWGNSTVPSQGLNQPSAIAFDVNGNIFVTDSNNGRIVKYSTAH